jgi:hypothetical protein
LLAHDQQQEDDQRQQEQDREHIAPIRPADQRLHRQASDDNRPHGVVANSVPDLLTLLPAGSPSSWWTRDANIPAAAALLL